jgi:hypothetical protein
LADDFPLAPALALLGDALLPPTPDIAAAVAPRLVPAPRRRRASRARLALAVLAAALALAAVALAADRFVFGGVAIVAHAPPPPRTRPPDAGLALGARSTAAAARQALGHPLVGIRSLGAPVAIHVAPVGRTVEVTLVWPASARLPAIGRTRAGLLLTEFAGSTEPPFFLKRLGPETTVERVEVGGAVGYLIAGAPHEIEIADADGGFAEHRVHVAGNVLLWQRGPLTLRLESALGRDAALALARNATLMKEEP